MADFNTYYDEEKKKGERMTGAIGDAFGEVARRTKEMINGPPAEVSDPMTSSTPEFRNPLMTGTSAPGTMAASGNDPFVPERNPITMGTPAITGTAGPARGNITGAPDTLQPMGESFAPQGSPQTHTPAGAQTIVQGGTHYHGPSGGGNMAPAGGGGGFDPNNFIQDSTGEKWSRAPGAEGGFNGPALEGGFSMANNAPTAGMSLSKGDVNYQTGRAERPMDYSQEEWSGLKKPEYGGSSILNEMWGRLKGMKDKHMIKGMAAIADLAKGVFMGNTGLDEGWLKAQANLREQGVKGQYGERDTALRNLGGIAQQKVGGTAQLASASTYAGASERNTRESGRTARDVADTRLTGTEDTIAGRIAQQEMKERAASPFAGTSNSMGEKSRRLTDSEIMKHNPNLKPEQIKDWRRQNER
jgi:hypothetical protein